MRSDEVSLDCSQGLFNPNIELFFLLFQTSCGGTYESAYDTEAGTGRWDVVKLKNILTNLKCKAKVCIFFAKPGQAMMVGHSCDCDRWSAPENYNHNSHFSKLILHTQNMLTGVCMCAYMQVSSRMRKYALSEGEGREREREMGVAMIQHHPRSLSHCWETKTNTHRTHRPILMMHLILKVSHHLFWLLQKV